MCSSLNQSPKANPSLSPNLIRSPIMYSRIPNSGEEQKKFRPYPSKKYRIDYAKDLKMAYIFTIVIFGHTMAGLTMAGLYKTEARGKVGKMGLLSKIIRI